MPKYESSSSSSEDEGEFQLPPGFSAVHLEPRLELQELQSKSKKLFFFRLPKNLDASALNGIEMSSNKSSTDETVAQFQVGETKYEIKVDDDFFANQLVNAFPEGSTSESYKLGKKFSKSFKVVENPCSIDFNETDVEEPVAPSPKKRRKR